MTQKQKIMHIQIDLSTKRLMIGAQKAKCRVRSSVERTGKKIDCRSRFQRDKRLMIGAHPTEFVIATKPNGGVPQADVAIYGST